MDERAPFEPHHTPANPPPPRRHRPARTYSLGVLATATAAALAAGIATGWAAFHGNTTEAKTANTASTTAPTAAATSSSAATITVHGSLTLKIGAFENIDNTNCTSLEGYNDISAGTAVTIGNQNGATIAVGQLGAGHIQGSRDTGDLRCVFGFDVPAPYGETLYTVTISHRGTQTFSPVQAVNGADMSLG